jgi:hypothetical protein
MYNTKDSCWEKEENWKDIYDFLAQQGFSLSIASPGSSDCRGTI